MSNRSGNASSKSAAAHAAWLAVALLTSGCTSLGQWWHNGFKVGPNYAEPPASTAPNWIDAADPRLQTDKADDCSWWTVFQDSSLNSLIETAYRQNLDIRAAGTRIIEARAQRNVAVGNLFPQSQTAIAAYAHAQLSPNLTGPGGVPFGGPFNVFADGLNASWELDFWGRYRRAIESADATVAAAFEAYGDSLVMMLSEVATSYVQIRTFQTRLEYARQNVEIQKGSLAIADARFRNGASSELDVAQAKANLAQTEALIPQLRAGLRQANNSLCVLLATPPADHVGQLARAAIPRAPATIAVGIPASLLRRRPDVRRAQFQVAAQSARVGVAEADFYPQLAINGFIGYTASDINDLFTPKSFTGIIFPTLQWNVLNYGRILNNVRTEDARLQTATLQYQQTVLRAGREVEDALVQFLEAQQQALYLAESVKHASRAVELVSLQFQGGVTDFNRVYTTEAQLVTQQDQLATTQGNIALQLIAVYRALGGGWQYFMDGQHKSDGQPPTKGLPPGVGQPPANGSVLPSLRALPEAIPPGQK